MTDAATPSPTRPLDPRAAGRVSERQAAAAEAPWLHAEAGRRMAERLAIFRQAPQRLLDLSGPAGGPAGLLRQALPGAALERVEPADTRRWWQRLGRAPRSLRADALPEARYDLLWSVMMLHWAPDPPAALRAWRRLLAPDGALMFCTLGPGTLGDLRSLYAEAGWGSPMAPLVDMHDLGDMLVEAGYDGPVMDQETLTLHWSGPEALLAELRAWGANADPARHAGLRTPRWREGLLAALRRRADAQGRIAMSFEIVYGHAMRGPDRGPQVAPDTRIELGEMAAMLKRRPAR